MKLIVLSDLHLMAPGAANDLGNQARLAAAVARINAGYDDADLVIVAGDIADRGSVAVYAEAHATLSQLTPPWVATVGNHDDRGAFLRVFDGTAGFAQYARVVDGHHVLVLDSLKLSPDGPYPVAPEGELCADRLSWLDARLAEAKGAPVVVALHHHVVPVDTRMDPYTLEAPEELIERLAAHGHVRHVISGHIHMTTTSFHRGIPFTTLAGGHSTSVEDFGRKTNKRRLTGPAQMAIVLSDDRKTTLHFDNYNDAHAAFERDET
ncbi:MAG: metallophosphoesterase [Pseudomonadota bacterium]